MPRLSKTEKRYWSFFIDPQTHRRKYYALCRRCKKECKQSFRIISLSCPFYVSKRSKKEKSVVSGTFAVPDDGFVIRQKTASDPAKKTWKSAPFCYTKKSASDRSESMDMCQIYSPDTFLLK